MRTISLIYFALFFAVTAAWSQSAKPLENPLEFQKKIKETAATTQTLKANFTEEKFVSYLKEPQSSTGVFYYKKDNKLRWEKIKPSKYILLVNGTKVRLSENNKEVNVSSLNQMIGGIKDLMITLLNGDFQKSKDFEASYFYTNGTYLVKLTPKNKRLAKIFDRFELVFSKNTMRLQSLSMFEKSGDKSIMKFYNDAINMDLSDNLFVEF